MIPFLKPLQGKKIALDPIPRVEEIQVLILDHFRK